MERLDLSGPAGNLEALLEGDPEWRPRMLSVVCHPHPVYGGTLHNKVVFRAAKASAHCGIPVLRFNFRGVGRSQGEFDHGKGEREDARAALAYLTERFPGLPVCMMGFSFGSVVALSVGAQEPCVNSLVGMGVPVNASDLSFLQPDTKPKLVVQGAHDEFGSREKVQAFFASLQEPKWLHIVEDADHFFAGKLLELQSTLQEFLQDVLKGLKLS